MRVGRWGLGAVIGIVSCILFPACSFLFGAKPPPESIRGYHDQTVIMRKGHYRVGAIGNEWHPSSSLLSSKNGALVFRNSGTGATVSTYAACGTRYDDATLAVLTRHLYMGVTDVTIQSQRETRIDDRQALWTRWQGMLDGVPVELETVSIKKNECLFDFYYVAFPESVERGRADFYRFVEGFSYQ